MTTLLFANDASTTLQSGISAASTTAVLAAGTGALFPPVGAGQAFFITFLDAATQQVKEIATVTARTGDTITIVRGQQGTTARAWNAGDLAAQLVTAGDSQGMLQPDTLQSAKFTAAMGGGTANSITATLQSGLTALPNLLAFTVEATAANTGAVTLTLTLGATVLSAHNVVKYGGSSLNAGDIPEAGFPIELTWVDTLSAYVMTNPASGTAGSIAGGVANDLLVQTAPGTTGFVPAPTVAGSVLAFLGGVIAWAAAAVTTFNGRSGAVVPANGDYNAAQVGAVPASAFQAPNVLLANPMFTIDPSGAIHQAGNRTISPNTDTVVSFPKIYPTACVSVVVSCDNQGAAINVHSLTRTGFSVRVAAGNITWSSDGY